MEKSRGQKSRATVPLMYIYPISCFLRKDNFTCLSLITYLANPCFYIPGTYLLSVMQIVRLFLRYHSCTPTLLSSFILYVLHQDPFLLSLFPPSLSLSPLLPISFSLHLPVYLSLSITLACVSFSYLYLLSSFLFQLSASPSLFLSLSRCLSILGHIPLC